MRYSDDWLQKIVSQGCGGWKTLSCNCGGDLCVCGLDGEDCPGCPECEDETIEDWETDFCGYCLGQGGQLPHAQGDGACN